MRNKKGQIDNPIIAFAVIIVGLLMFVPLTFTILNETTKGFEKGLTSIDETNKSSEAVSELRTDTLEWLDFLVIGIFFVLVIVMMVSSFLIDINPFFMILYIVSVIGLFVFGGGLMDAVIQIWSVDTFDEVVSYMPMTQFLISNFFTITLGIVLLTGVVIYAKIKRSNQYT